MKSSQISTDVKVKNLRSSAIFNLRPSVGKGFIPPFLKVTNSIKGRPGFTLVEAIFTISILALVLVAMAPFIRTVYISWNLGDRKTEIQQNARVGLEMMSRLIRQAKRITGIPASGSGDFVEFRGEGITQTIIIYHNVPTSSYYIGEIGLISDNDLVMRTIDINGVINNALLAKSLSNFNLDFRDNAGQLTTQPYNVSSLDISMRLIDPEGLIPDTVEIYSNISLRSELRINRPVWVAAGSYVVELSTDNWIAGFASPNSVSVNSLDGSCWVADTNNNRIKKLSSTGTVLLDIPNFKQPQSVSVNSTTGECWVADTGSDRIKKLSSTGTVLLNISNFKQPRSVSVNPTTGECWVADTEKNKQIKKLSSSGAVLVYVGGFKQPQSVSVNPNTGECWVADTGSDSIKKLSSSGAVLVYVGGFKRPQSVSVNATTGECWVADTNNNRIKKLSSTGTVSLDISNFKQPQSVSVNPNTGECWVADTGNNQVVKLDSEGNEEFRISGFQSPLSISVLP